MLVDQSKEAAANSMEQEENNFFSEKSISQLCIARDIRLIVCSSHPSILQAYQKATPPTTFVWHSSLALLSDREVKRTCNKPKLEPLRASNASKVQYLANDVHLQ